MTRHPFPTPETRAVEEGIAHRITSREAFEHGFADKVISHTGRPTTN